MVTVLLAQRDRLLADAVAAMRHREAMAGGRRPSHGCRLEDALRRHQEGARGELAVALALEIDWDGMGADGDVGTYQVRTTGYQGGHLLLHDWDRKDAVFILVTASLDGWTFTLRGWLYGIDGMAYGYWRDGARPCYWVPQSALMPMDTLPMAGEKITAKGGD